jgi:acetate kinase
MNGNLSGVTRASVLVFAALLRIFAHHDYPDVPSFRFQAHRGVDHSVGTIVFLTEHVEESARFITEICGGLEFLGIRCKTNPDVDHDYRWLSEDDSPVRVSLLRCNRWDIVAHRVTTLIT